METSVLRRFPVFLADPGTFASVGRIDSLFSFDIEERQAIDRLVA